MCGCAQFSISGWPPYAISIMTLLAYLGCIFGLESIVGICYKRISDRLPQHRIRLWRETRSLSVASRHVCVRTLRRTARAPRGYTAAAAAAARTARQPRGTLYGVHLRRPSWSIKEDCEEPGKETMCMSVPARVRRNLWRKGPT